eukprot:Skav200551  [mRNA]  locus=scaffold676:547213:548164:- [translate_table: standard]
MENRGEESRSKKVSSHSSSSTSHRRRAPRDRLQAENPSPHRPRRNSPARTSQHKKETRDVPHLRSERSPACNGKRPRSEDRTHSKFQRKYPQYGFDWRDYYNKTEALNAFVMRLVAPGEPAASSLVPPVEVEGGFQGTLTLDREHFVCERLWPEEGATKCFVGEICSEPGAARDSAVEKFWDDPKVQEAALTLPPSKRKKDRIANRNAYLPRILYRQHAINEAKRSHRLAEGRARSR